MIVVLPRRCETMGDFCAFDRLHLNNKNKKKSLFILYCLHFPLPLPSRTKNKLKR